MKTANKHMHVQATVSNCAVRSSVTFPSVTRSGYFCVVTVSYVPFVRAEKPKSLTESLILFPSVEDNRKKHMSCLAALHKAE